MGCSYNYTAGESVQQTEWYKGRRQSGFWTSGVWKHVALSNSPSFHNRFEYLGDRRHDCSVAIHDLWVNDTGHYHFRFDMETFHRWSQTSVYLTVTELSASVSPAGVRAGDNVTLRCETSCPHEATVWFKDGLPVARAQFQARAEDSGNYACALKGVESFLSDPVALDVQYPPLNVSVETSSSASGVNLTCSSAANPAADSYTWYRGAGSSPGPLLEVGSGPVLSLASGGGAAHAGLYYRCRASNHLGGSYSPGPLLPVTPDSTDNISLCDA
ncbi:B-cell receptor CD22 [Liparis tanakae]|uniref:B-cell receptor CD22 n=1 Tax=Liparis tanakae TaxID=230148 RepID=A0A4Z2G2S5_9TELE|nr:B-cell receptor CD22 [Liparis tanakae]